MERLEKEMERYPEAGTGNQRRWISHRIQKLGAHIKSIKESIILKIDRLCKEHCGKSLLSLLAKKRNVERVKYNEIEDIGEVFSLFDEALAEVFKENGDNITNDIDNCNTGANDSLGMTRSQVNECYKDMLKSLKTAVENNPFPSQAPSLEWIESKRKQLTSQSSVAKKLELGAKELQQNISYQISICEAKKKNGVTTDSSTNVYQLGLFSN